MRDVKETVARWEFGLWSGCWGIMFRNLHSGDRTLLNLCKNMPSPVVIITKKTATNACLNKGLSAFELWINTLMMISPPTECISIQGYEQNSNHVSVIFLCFTFTLGVDKAKDSHHKESF